MKRNFGIITFIIVLASIAFVHSFFDFLKSSTASTPTVTHTVPAVVPEIDRFRGVAPTQRDKYSGNSFTCDNGQRQLDPSSINDGYCDCLDHSDEPGTSACDRGVFYCINKGYRMIKIPSSRVDDGICDCCDGSDEGIYAKCADTCSTVAAKERSALSQLIQTYKAGNQVKKQMEQNMLEELEKKAAQFQTTVKELENVRFQVSELETKVNEKENQAKTAKGTEEKELKGRINKLLRISSDQFEQSAKFLSNLVSALDLDEMQLAHFAPEKGSDQANGDSYQDDYEVNPEAAPAEDSNEGCEITNLTGNPNLAVLCDAKNKGEAVVSMVYGILLDKKPFTEAMLILGHHSLFQSFDGSHEFVKNHIAQFGADVCPSAFESLHHHCETKDILRDMLTHLETTQKNFIDNADPELSQFKSELTNLRAKVYDLQQLERESTSAEDDLEKYKGKYAFLKLKNQCFDVEDGKFSYSLCVLQNVKQKELNGFNTVTLGDFEKLEESDAHGHSYKMRFHNGQYCHAFGPRSAEVTITCGEKNQLKSAAEPSTCFYALTFESPAARTEEFAQMNNLI
jgi:protein kinase C substrate 80K-H